jgi:hypothetical protein
MGRLNYTTDCHAKDGYPMPFPDIRTQTAESGMRGLAAVRSVFRNNRQVSIKRDPSRVIEMTFGNPSTSLLQTRIHSVTLEPLARYNPTMALDAIGETKEVKVAMHKGGLEFPLIVTDMWVVTPEKGRPHLPAKLEDITVERALDLIAKTFRGVATFGICGQAGDKRLVSMDFLFLEGRIETNAEH